MKEEIKEILDDFKEILDNPTTTDECYDGRIIEIDRGYDLDLDEIKLLLDYITNLQEENERLKEQNKMTDEQIEKTLEFVSEHIYKSRIDKAIEYINKLSSKGRDCEIYWDIKKEILNILQGEDKE